ncbi:MAG TPA: hypothetical protein VFB38_27335 [Chthonomonadaceae bacterium]|nr:hypothetical protein [Chthonomonadaceae bacterium]
MQRFKLTARGSARPTPQTDVPAERGAAARARLQNSLNRLLDRLIFLLMAAITLTLAWPLCLVWLHQAQAARTQASFSASSSSLKARRLLLRSRRDAI